MRENFLYYVWQHRKWNILPLVTTQHEPLEIISVGLLNLNSGPDFFNGRLRIGEQLWAGNVEIHVKSSDWYRHGHEKDLAYDNVILHVVYEHDCNIFRKDNSIIPTLELKSYIDPKLMGNYRSLFSINDKWINCEANFNEVPDLILGNWLERLYFERLEQKSEIIEDLLKKSKNNWEAVLFKLLAKTYGLKVNGDAFFSVANSMDFSVIRKTQSKLATLEALLFGQAGLLDKDTNVPYAITLQREYRFLKQKFGLNNSGVVPYKFFRLRPLNFPTIRLSQLANLYHHKHNLFSRIISVETLSELYELLEVQASNFWNTHYTFHKASRSSIKKTSRSFVNLLLINTIIPMKFCYAKHKKLSVDEHILKLIMSIKSEKNGIVNCFNAMRPISKSAMQSQALIQLKTEYCDKHQCLKCAIGHSLLNK